MNQLRARYKNLRANLNAVEQEYKLKCKVQTTPECAKLKEEMEKLRIEKSIIDIQLMDLVDRLPRKQNKAKARVVFNSPEAFLNEPAVGPSTFP